MDGQLHVLLFTGSQQFEAMTSGYSLLILLIYDVIKCFVQHFLQLSAIWYSFQYQTTLEVASFQYHSTNIIFNHYPRNMIYQYHATHVTYQHCPTNIIFKLFYTFFLLIYYRFDHCNNPLLLSPSITLFHQCCHQILIYKLFTRAILLSNYTFLYYPHIVLRRTIDRLCLYRSILIF